MMNKDKNILIASMGRTGSHLLVEIVSFFFENVKHIHYYNDDIYKWADIIISTKRDFREQMASTKRHLTKTGAGYYTSILDDDGIYRGKKRTIVEECEMVLGIYFEWENKTSKYFKLEDWFTNPIKYIHDVLFFFNIKTTKIKIKEIVEKLKKPIKENHITKTNNLINYKDTLTDDELSSIMNIFDTKYKKQKDTFIYIENYLKEK